MGGGINQTRKSAESPKSFELQAPPLLQMRTGAHGRGPAPTPCPTTLGLRPTRVSRQTPHQVRGEGGGVRRTPEWEVLTHHELGNFTASFIQGQLTREGGATASNAMKHDSLLILISSH